MNINYSHSIAPEKVVRGINAWNDGSLLVPSLSKRPIIIGRNISTLKTRLKLKHDLEKLGINPTITSINYDCCELDLLNLEATIIKNNSDCVIAVGGGKVLDTGKLIADRISIPCITIPLSAATCAGWTALSNIYSPEGAFLKDVILKNCPNLLIFDYDLVRTSSTRTLSSGIADALAKWYEASLTSKESSDGLVQQAVQMARVLRDQLLIDGKAALENNKTDSWERVVEACALTAGLIGGIGGPRCRTAAAHALHNGLTQLKFKNKPLHGELVGLGILAQLRLEEIHNKNELAKQGRFQLIEFMKIINLPTNTNDIGVSDFTLRNLLEACEFSFNDGLGMSNLPFKASPSSLLEALITTEIEYNSTKTKITEVKISND